MYLSDIGEQVCWIKLKGRAIKFFHVVVLEVLKIYVELHLMIILVFLIKFLPCFSPWSRYSYIQYIAVICNVKLHFNVFNMQIWHWMFSVVQYRE